MPHVKSIAIVVALVCIVVPLRCLADQSANAMNVVKLIDGSTKKVAAREEQPTKLYDKDVDQTLTWSYEKAGVTDPNVLGGVHNAGLGLYLFWENDFRRRFYTAQMEKLQSSKSFVLSQRSVTNQEAYDQAKQVTQGMQCWRQQEVRLLDLVRSAVDLQGRAAFIAQLRGAASGRYYDKVMKAGYEPATMRAAGMERDETNALLDRNLAPLQTRIDETRKQFDATIERSCFETLSSKLVGACAWLSAYPEQARMREGGQIRVELQYGPGGCTPPSGRVLYASSDETMVDVSPDGVISAKKAGVPIIVAVKHGTLNAPNIVITVIPQYGCMALRLSYLGEWDLKETGIGPHLNFLSLLPARHYAALYAFLPSDCTKPEGSPSFQSDNAAVATVDPSSGDLTLHAAGTAHVSISFGSSATWVLFDEVTIRV